MVDTFFAQAAELSAQGIPFATATVVRAERPTSGKPGDKAIITADGTMYGWIGGSCAQPTVIREALAALRSDESRFVRLSPDPANQPPRDGLIDVPMTCFSGGTMEIYIEPQPPQPRLIVVGGLPVARALAESTSERSLRFVLLANGSGSFAGDERSGASAYMREMRKRGDKTPMFAGIEDMRFRKPVIPGDQLVMEFTLEKLRGPVGKGHVKATVDGKIAAEGMVLLKNDGLLPLKGHQHIAVIGRAAEAAHFQGGGSSHINPTRTDVPFKELQARADDAELTYAEGYPSDDCFRQDLIDQATVIAKAADVALLYIALPTYKESEGYDRKDLDLTAQQIALIKAVARVQPRTVVVLNNGAPVAMSAWLDDVSAVLEGWMMGQAGGAALADILFGRVNPSGKLAETFPLRLSDTPAFTNWPGDAGKVHYGEGLYIGYRYYDARELPVLFPFGFGLSYTTFAYSNPRLSAETFKDVDGLTITVDVTNTGSVAGKETVQVYVHDRASSLTRPIKELKGFAKVELQPGETKSVSIHLDSRAFAFWHPEHRQWVTEDGEVELLIGASAADIRCQASATLQSTLELPCLLDMESTMREWMADPRGKQVLGALYAQVEAQTRKMFGESERYGNEESNGHAESGIGMDIMDMMNDMPVVSVLMFQQSALTMPAEEIVTGLLRQVQRIN